MIGNTGILQLQRSRTMRRRASPCWALLISLAATAAMGAENVGGRGGKPAAKQTPPVGAKSSSGAKPAENLDLNGTWRGYVVEGKGQNPNRGSVHLELKIQGNRISAQRLDGQGGFLGEGTYQITAERFYMIDATEIRERGKGRTYLGICRFAPDLMYWSVANPGNPRPVDFETKGRQFLLILKRQRP
jgi:hypothetical protein